MCDALQGIVGGGENLRQPLGSVGGRRGKQWQGTLLRLRDGSVPGGQGGTVCMGLGRGWDGLPGAQGGLPRKRFLGKESLGMGVRA